MLRVVLAGCGGLLMVGAVSWGIAAIRMRRRALVHANHGLPAERMQGLTIRDALVSVLMCLVAVATFAEAFDSHVSASDLFMAFALIPIVALLPWVRRYQGHVELAQDEADARERTRLELLYEVAVAGEDLDLVTALQRLADALRPTLGDWGMVVLLDRHGDIDTLAVSRSGDEKDEVVEELLRRYPADVRSGAGLGRALQTGERVVYADITDELLASEARDEDHLAMLRALYLGAAVIEPMTARGRRVGAIGIITRSGRPIEVHTLTLVHEVADRAAPVLDNSRLHRDLLETDEALRFSEAVLRAQGESGVEGLLVVSPAGELIYHNSRFTEMWGFENADLDSGLDDDALTKAMHKVDDPEGFVRQVRATYENPVGPRRDEIHFKDGRVFDRYGAPLRSDEESYLGWAWYFRDITHERRVQQSLLESGERFASLARTLQESLLPPDLPAIYGAEIAARYHPAGDGSEVGGDFYDVFQIAESEWCAVIGDVCGKGAAAARLTALARYTLRAAAIRSPSIVDNLETLNGALVRQSVEDRRRGESRFATASVIRFQPHETGVGVRAGSGGHPPPIVVRSDGEVETVACRGTLLGIFDEVRFVPEDTDLRVGDVLVLYTDGVTEAQRAGELFGEERLVEVLRECKGCTAAEVTAAVEDAALGFQDGVARDDIAVLALRAVEGT